MKEDPSHPKFRREKQINLRKPRNKTKREFGSSIERFSIECRKTKTKTNYIHVSIRLLSQSQTVVKPKPNQNQLSNYFRHSIENRFKASFNMIWTPIYMPADWYNLYGDIKMNNVHMKQSKQTK